ncbi:MAG TPA: 4-vinyl reductase [Gemmatimonadales bacterium]|jgi:predicted hydrocarbon binding protein|nr:4-vinyl reductase [Gemmatimonadales bacterium]
MSPAPSLSSSHCVALGRRALHQLRASLERDTGLQSATYLQEAGFAAGEEVFQAFSTWLQASYGLEQPAQLDVKHLGSILDKFFQESGWGPLTVTPLGPAVALDSTDWSEAGPSGSSSYPTCHVTSGMLADFLSRMSGGLVGVMEVECRSRGDAKCRFLAGAPETLDSVYAGMAQGQSYMDALGVVG